MQQAAHSSIIDTHFGGDQQAQALVNAAFPLFNCNEGGWDAISDLYDAEGEKADEIIEKLTELQTALNLSDEQLNWVVRNAEAVDLMDEIIQEVDDPTAFVNYAKERIDAVIEHNGAFLDFAFTFLMVTPPGFGNGPIEYEDAIYIPNLRERLDCFDDVNTSGCAFKVSLLVDQVEPGKPTPFLAIKDEDGKTKDVDPGHTFVMIEQTFPDGRQVRLAFGFYPAETLKYGPNVKGAWYENTYHHYDVGMEWNLTEANFITLVNGFKAKGENPPPRYDLEHENCTSLPVRLLNQIGCGIPETIVNYERDDDKGMCPGRLGEDLRTTPVQPWMNFLPNPGTAPLPRGCAE